MTTSIFYKSYEKDFGWLQHSLRSVKKFASGFVETVVMIPEGTDFQFPGVRVVKVVEEGHPYLFQQTCKLHADRVTETDQVLFQDSDTLFTRPFTPDTFVRDGKIIWLKTPMQGSGGETWLDSMRTWFGSTPAFEYQRRHPFLFPKCLFDEMRNFTQFLHAKDLRTYIAEAGQFSEFNCAGLLAEAKFKDRFLFLDTTKDEIPAACVKQWHSHDGVDSALEEIEAILGNELLDKLNTEQEQRGDERRGMVAKYFEGMPPHSKEELMKKPKENPVSFAIATLTAEAQKSGLHKARMVAALVKAGLIEAKAKKPAKRRMARA